MLFDSTRPFDAICECALTGVVPSSWCKSEAGKAWMCIAQRATRLKRRQAIELVGHTQADHRMDRHGLKGAEGDALHAVLCRAASTFTLAAAGDCPAGPAGPFVGLVRTSPTCGKQDN